MTVTACAAGTTVYMSGIVNTLATIKLERDHRLQSGIIGPRAARFFGQASSLRRKDGANTVGGRICYAAEFTLDCAR